MSFSTRSHHAEPAREDHVDRLDSKMRQLQDQVDSLRKDFFELKSNSVLEQRAILASVEQQYEHVRQHVNEQVMKIESQVLGMENHFAARMEGMREAAVQAAQSASFDGEGNVERAAGLIADVQTNVESIRSELVHLQQWVTHSITHSQAQLQGAMKDLQLTGKEKDKLHKKVLEMSIHEHDEREQSLQHIVLQLIQEQEKMQLEMRRYREVQALQALKDTEIKAREGDFKRVALQKLAELQEEVQHKDLGRTQKAQTGVLLQAMEAILQATTLDAATGLPLHNPFLPSQIAPPSQDAVAGRTDVPPVVVEAQRVLDAYKRRTAASSMPLDIDQVVPPFGAPPGGGPPLGPHDSDRLRSLVETSYEAAASDRVTAQTLERLLKRSQGNQKSVLEELLDDESDAVSLASEPRDGAPFSRQTPSQLLQSLGGYGSTILGTAPPHPVHSSYQYPPGGGGPMLTGDSAGWTPSILGAAPPMPQPGHSEPVVPPFDRQARAASGSVPFACPQQGYINPPILGAQAVDHPDPQVSSAMLNADRSFYPQH